MGAQIPQPNGRAGSTHLSPRRDRSALLRSVSGGRRFSALEIANECNQRDTRKCDPRSDAKAVHERQQAHLMLELPEETRVGGCRGVRSGEALANQVGLRGLRRNNNSVVI